jgi:hypothetical protein
MNAMKTTAHVPGIRILGSKILLLGAVVLMVVAVGQKPSMLLLLLTPKGMAATAIRLFMGLLAAVCIRAYLPGTARRPNALQPGGWRTLASFVLMAALLAAMYTVLGSRAFSGLRLGDLLMHRAFLTQVLAFALLWLRLLK